MDSAAIDRFEASRGRPGSLAYRLLGSAVDAEDAVQDMFLRWQAANREEPHLGSMWALPWGDGVTSESQSLVAFTVIPPCFPLVLMRLWCGRNTWRHVQCARRPHSAGIASHEVV
ncbi:sigma factor (plasmid) [Streptomyces sp. FXJ1.172]|jgi:hypothetical protein|nr:sigma factor [Streptomyces sp. FXJ1.172]WEP01042.1 sigma factor [Streptomyces sp. FXJ1.172]